MRIISGKYKGREIRAAKGIRPTQDKIRKMLFDILGDIQGLSFLELFAGSGAIGLEAWSRGVANLTLVESDRECIRAIRKNLASLGITACRLYHFDASTAIEELRAEKAKFDLIFLDPPYHKQSSASRLRLGVATANFGGSLAKKTLQTLGAYDILAANGFIIVEHFKKDELPGDAGGFTLFKQKKCSDTLLSFYKKP